MLMPLFLSSAENSEFVIERQKIYREKYSNFGFTPTAFITFSYTDEQRKLKTENITLFECNANKEELAKLTEKEVKEFNKALGYTDYKPEKPEPDIAPETQPKSLDISEE